MIHSLRHLTFPYFRGRAFSANVASDTSQAIILNETAVRLLGWGGRPDWQANFVTSI